MSFPDAPRSPTLVTATWTIVRESRLFDVRTSQEGAVERHELTGLPVRIWPCNEQPLRNSGNFSSLHVNYFYFIMADIDKDVVVVGVLEDARFFTAVWHLAELGSNHPSAVPVYQATALIQLDTNAKC
ncbi:MAG: hypothetical protein ACJAZO_003108 [Myxococcota bacterium]|jgi:hypothetical protein